MPLKVFGLWTNPMDTTTPNHTNTWKLHENWHRQIRKIDDYRYFAKVHMLLNLWLIFFFFEFWLFPFQDVFLVSISLFVNSRALLTADSIGCTFFLDELDFEGPKVLSVFLRVQTNRNYNISTDVVNVLFTYSML